MEDVIRVVDSKEPGDQVTLTLMRGKDERTVEGDARQPSRQRSSGFGSSTDTPALATRARTSSAPPSPS